MKRFFSTFLSVVVITLSFNNLSIGQIDPSTNVVGEFEFLERNEYEVHEYSSTKSAGIACNPNTFFSVNSAGEIKEHTLIGGTITASTIVLTGCGNNLAICDNLNGTFSPTFYTGYSPEYYDGVTWVSTGVTGPLKFNPGGNTTNLYFSSQISGGYIKKIDRFDGANYLPVFSDNNRIIAVADLAVDTYGNVWFVTTSDSMTFIAQEIQVYSPTGTLIITYPINFNAINSYGAMILNDTYYIGFGNSNTVYPDQLVPINIVAGNAVIGTPIPMPAEDFKDLASCNHGDPINPLSLGTYSKSKEVTITPNPANDEIILTGVGQLTGLTTITITALTGETVATPKADGEVINVSKLSKGLYVINIVNGDSNYRIPFIKN